MCFPNSKCSRVMYVMFSVMKVIKHMQVGPKVIHVLHYLQSSFC